MIDISKRQFKIWTQQLLDWLEGKFTGQINDAKEEIIAAVEGIDPYVALSESELDGITSDEDLNTSTNE